jgi:hypothetical protein
MERQDDDFDLGLPSSIFYENRKRASLKSLTGLKRLAKSAFCANSLDPYQARIRARRKVSKGGHISVANIVAPAIARARVMQSRSTSTSHVEFGCVSKKGERNEDQGE